MNIAFICYIHPSNKSVGEPLSTVFGHQTAPSDLARQNLLFFFANAGAFSWVHGITPKGEDDRMSYADVVDVK